MVSRTSLPAERSGSASEARREIAARLEADLIGPGIGLEAEILPQAPSRWYLTGFLVPSSAPEEQRAGDAEAEGDLDSGDDTGGTDDQHTPDKGSARRAWRPSSLGLSFLVADNVSVLDVDVRWGDYTRSDSVVERDGTGEAEGASGKHSSTEQWKRAPREGTVAVSIEIKDRASLKIPNSDGLTLEVLKRRTTITMADRDLEGKSISVFLVNRRAPREDKKSADEAFAFQAKITIRCADGFLPRYALHGLHSEDFDERLADLHYRDVAEYAVGHNTSAEWTIADGVCTSISSCCAPLTAVPRVVPNETIANFELSMEALGEFTDAAAAQAKLAGVVTEYRRWIEAETRKLPGLSERRREVASALIADAEFAASRIAAGIAELSQPHVLEAFAIANRAVARAARQRGTQVRKITPAKAEPPRWRPFQIAFILLNLRGVVEPTHGEREIVDLLFFPTGGGKTEAYLGLAAFTIAYRRLTNPGLTGAGLSVLMRYTLRLLTLDQLARASAVVCALELERERHKPLGDWPIEIGLWVGRAASPNRMGYKGDKDGQGRNARSKVLRYCKDSKKPLPVPIRECPWCGTAFKCDSFSLVDDHGKSNSDYPTNLQLRCVNRACDFALSRRPLPIITVDEPIYRRLPAFLIATVDKFAGMPWAGEIGGFFGGADRYDQGGFYAAAEPKGGQPVSKPLAPPDLIIQDELHLISGPLGTMVGLYESAIDALATIHERYKDVRPKIVVSTATVRRAQNQVRALFDRRETRIFPPPGPDREDSFFAQSLPIDDPGSRHYLGLAVPGGSPKVLFLRSAVSLMAIAETAWEQYPPDEKNPAEPFMTLVSYFNALRELGGARRIVEEEIGPRLLTYDRRLRVGETENLKARRIKYEVLELTSRVSTDAVAEAKRKLASTFKGRDDNDSVDIALATNMISVGLDITRLGLMLVSGQPKTTSEYIQATSRVGRDPARPGLVVVLLNVNKPRDRSHYERFVAYHSMFYRSVEATSVTPFSPRALDRALASVAVALGRLELPAFTPNNGARLAKNQRGDLDVVVEALANRAASHKEQSAQEQAEAKANVGQRVSHILDSWAQIAAEVGTDAGGLGYQKEAGVAKHLLYDMLDTEPLPPYWRQFRSPRSLRDVEPSVLLTVTTPTGQKLSEE